jgi:hypothetical protein
MCGITKTCISIDQNTTSGKLNKCTQVLVLNIV